MKNLLIASLLLLSGCASTSPAPNAPVNAVFFGDSITQRDPGYAPTVAQDMGWTYVNHAIGGTQIDRTHDEVMRADLSNKQVAIVFVGYNDMRFNGLDPVHLAFFKAQLKESLQYLVFQGLHVYLGNCFKMYGENYQMFAPFDKGSDEAAKAYSDVIDEVMVEIHSSQITLINVTDEFKSAPEMYDDKVHPSVEGTAQLVTIFEEGIKQ